MEAESSASKDVRAHGKVNITWRAFPDWLSGREAVQIQVGFLFFDFGEGNSK